MLIFILLHQNQPSRTVFHPPPIIHPSTFISIFIWYHIPAKIISTNYKRIRDDDDDDDENVDIDDDDDFLLKFLKVNFKAKRKL